MNRQNKGYIHIYTGDGKGKSSAANGLAARMVGSGGRVSIIRFLKGQKTSEDAFLLSSEKVNITHFGSKDFVAATPSQEDLREAKRGTDLAAEQISSGKYDLVVLDEIIVAVSLKLLTEADVLTLLKRKAKSTELVLTGRGATPEIIEAADLVTDMQNTKHYYDQGVKARKGIEF
jgi:cob(I)alamin adenosyltransferase